MNTTKSLANSKKRQTIFAATIFLVPVFFFITVYIIYPIFDSFSLSLSDWNGIDSARKFIGLGNWTSLLGDGVFFKAFSNNIIIMVLSILIQLPIGIALAVFLDIGGKKLNIFKVIYFLPMLMSSVAVGFLFKYVYDPQFGFINAVLGLLNRSGMVDILGNPSIAIFAVIAVICWQFTPFYMVYFLAGLSTLPAEIYEAAIIDGATRSKYFWRVALPMLQGTVKSAIVLSLVGSLKYFDLIWVMTEGGPTGSTELMATYMYKNAFQTMKMGYGATIASAMFIIITSISLITLRAMNSKEGGI
jgi:raffinose/stachyose/melibiose transport system permease protein